jgi:phage FluMu protein Com
MEHLEVKDLDGKLYFRVKCPKCKKMIDFVLSDVTFDYEKCKCGCLFDIELVVKARR